MANLNKTGIGLGITAGILAIYAAGFTVGKYQIAGKYSTWLLVIISSLFFLIVSAILFATTTMKGLVSLATVGMVLSFLGLIYGAYQFRSEYKNRMYA